MGCVRSKSASNAGSFSTTSNPNMNRLGIVKELRVSTAIRSAGAGDRGSFGVLPPLPRSHHHKQQGGGGGGGGGIGLPIQRHGSTTSSFSGFASYMEDEETNPIHLAADRSYTPYRGQPLKTTNDDRMRRELDTRSVVISSDEDGNEMINDYVLIKLLGSGTYGKVHLCYDSRSEDLCAVKSCRRSALQRQQILQGSSSSSFGNSTLREIAVMKKLDHPNLVSLIEVIDDVHHDQLFIVMEYVDRGSIMTLDPLTGRANREPFSEQESRLIWCQLLAGISYLHDQGIIHADIKPANLLVDRDNTLKVCDFGVSEILTNKDDDLIYGDMTTPGYVAPEVLLSDDRVSGRPVDVWAAGLTLFILNAGYHPFCLKSVEELNRDILDKKIEYPSHFSKSLVDLLSGALERDPRKRLTIKDMINHPWTRGDGNIQSDIFRTPSPVFVSQSELCSAIATSSYQTIENRKAMLVRVRKALQKRVSSSNRRRSETDLLVFHRLAPLFDNSLEVKDAKILSASSELVVQRFDSTQMNHYDDSDQNTSSLLLAQSVPPQFYFDRK